MIHLSKTSSIILLAPLTSMKLNNSVFISLIRARMRPFGFLSALFVLIRLLNWSVPSSKPWWSRFRYKLIHVTHINGFCLLRQKMAGLRWWLRFHPDCQATADFIQTLVQNRWQLVNFMRHRLSLSSRFYIEHQYISMEILPSWISKLLKYF